MPDARYEDWDDLVRLIQRYTSRKYGCRATAVTIHLSTGKQHVEPMPDVLSLPANRPPTLVTWASGDRPKRLSDFQKVYWPSLGAFTFTPKQALAVKVLWEAWQDGTHKVDQRQLLEAADSAGTRLRDLFARSPAWDRLIVHAGAGHYRLAPLEDEGADDVDGGNEEEAG